MPWDWVTFPDFIESLIRTPKGVNCLTYVPLTPLYAWVMGWEEAKKRRPTEAELQEMCRLIHEAMDAGACGWSAQVLGAKSIQRDYDGTPMITDLLSEHEVLTFAGILADRDEGFIELAYQETGEEGRPLAEATKRFFEKVAAVAKRPVPVPGRRSELGASRTTPRTDSLAGKLHGPGIARLWPGCHPARRVRDDLRGLEPVR